MKGSELPPAWAEEAGASADGSYTVTIEAADPELAAAETLEAVIAITQRRAKERGLTPDILENILKTD